MAKVEREDGARLHYEVHGQGPGVVVPSYWNSHPSVFDGLIAELSGDHSVVIYDDRGNGESSDDGPYDFATGASDLGAILEDAGVTPAVAIATSDGVLRAAALASERGDLIDALVCVGATPMDFETLDGSDAMIGSSTVVDAFIQQVEIDYRGAIRALITAVNPQMSEDEVRERVSRQVDYTPHEVSLARVRAWRAHSGAAELGRALGDRLWILTGADVGGAWFPPVEELEGLIAEHLPDAHVQRVGGGIISRPEETAAVVRELTAARASADLASS